MVQGEKRKKNKKEIRIKKRKLSDAEAEEIETPDPAAEGEDQLYDPTKEELAAAAKPENQCAIETIRQTKQKKHSKNLQQLKLKTTNVETRKNIDYIVNWKDNRDQWKFEKLRQISIQKNVFDDEKIPEEIWDSVVEYLKGCKGRSRDDLVKLAQKLIEKQDKIGGAKDNSMKVKYSRARDVLQILQ